MAPNPHLPVVVGVGQTVRKLESAEGATEPVEMMADALRLAAVDAGPGASLLERADSVRTVETIAWRYGDAAATVAGLVGASPRQTVKAVTGGNGPQALVNHTASAIQRGDVDVALIAGAEAIYTRLLARKQGVHLEWSQLDPSAAPTDLVGIDRPGTSNEEMARSLVMPTQVYPVFENALRAASGRSVEDHQIWVSEWWARFSEVAARNPYAWSPVARSPQEVRTASADNRMIGFPYPKLMNANIQTDQAAALILCSVEAARAAGVPEERWVYVHAGADAHDHWWVSERADLVSSPAIRACGAAAFALTGIGAADVAHVDLYSCFPCAVEVAAAELGFAVDDPSRPLTVTGGLGFAGGPGNNYTTHAIATMVERLRADPGSYAVVTANGWYLTKHSIGVYSTRPPAAGEFRYADAQPEVDASPSRVHVADHDGPAVVESYTVMHERDGSPVLGIVACLTPVGERTWANSNEPGLLKEMTVDEFVGRPCRLRAGGVIEF